MAAKKKHAYFNGGRGIAELSDNSNSPRPLSNVSSEHDVSYSEGSTSHSSPLQVSYSEGSTSHSSPLQDSPSPSEYLPNTVYCQDSTVFGPPTYRHSTYPDYLVGDTNNLVAIAHSSNGYPESSPGFRGVVPYPSISCPDPPGNGRGGYHEEEDDDIHKPKKRQQKCRMCANHNKQVDVKGHKWYCPYRECQCNDCDITRKTQYYMKERQKLTRHQQQQSDDRHPNGFDTPRRRTQDNNLIDFPRKDEMERDTENILDLDLFDKINQMCRPKSNFRQ